MTRPFDARAEISPEAVEDLSVRGTLEELCSRGIALSFANLCRLPELLSGRARPLPLSGRCAPVIPAEGKLPELYPPSCGGPEGWLSGMACDLTLFPFAEGDGLSEHAVTATDADTLCCALTPASTRLATPYAAACAAFVRAAAELCAAGAGRPARAEASLPCTAEGLAGLCALLDAAAAFGCALTLTEGPARLCLYAPRAAEAPTRFTAAGNSVWFLAAPTCSDTLPDLTGIAASHAHFRAQRPTGAARAVGAGGPAEALLSLCGGLGFTACEELDIFAFLLINFGGVVAESAEPLPGALRIGTVSGDGRFTFPDGRGAAVADLAGYRRAAFRAARA